MQKKDRERNLSHRENKSLEKNERAQQSCREREREREREKKEINVYVYTYVCSQSTKSTRVEIVTTKSPVLSTVVEVSPKPEDVPGVKNNLAEPEYDFLSKQPTEVVDETYKVGI